MTQLTSTHVAGVFEARVFEDPSTVWDEIANDDGVSPVRINERSSQQIAAVFQAVQVIAGDVGQLPAIAYERVDEGKRRAVSHPAYRLLRRAPNPEMGPFQFKYLMQSRCCLWGNAYAYIQRQSGLPVALWPIEPGSIHPVRVDGQLVYSVIGEDGRHEMLDASEVFHLRGPGTDDLAGSSVVTLARESMSAGMQADRYANRFLLNNATPPISLEFPEAVDKDTAQNILKRWSSRHAGPHNAGKPGFLDRGGKVNTYAMNHQDAQFLETRRFTKSEIASWFNLPPHKVGDLENATFSNIEQQSIDYVVFSLMPWLVRWQDECNRKLMQPEEIENDRYFVEFLTAALVRGDLQARMEAYNLGINSGIFTFNEVRAMENLNPVEGGDRRLVPLNMSLVDETGEVIQASGPGADDAQRAIEPLVHRELEKLCERLGSAAQKAAKKPKEFLRWLDEGLENDHRKVVSSSIELMERSTGQESGLVDQLFERFRVILHNAWDGEPRGFSSRVAKATALFTIIAPQKGTNYLVRGEKWNDDTPDSQ